MTRALLRAACALAVSSALVAQAPRQVPAAPPVPDQSVDPLHQKGENVTISLLTMGSGTKLWELFGHNAILIHDNVTERDTVFNWGVFSFRQSNFLLRFLKGDMWYAMGGDSLQWIGIAYRYLNRTVYSQELDLTATEKDSVLKQIRWYAQPENVNYKYDYYLDNCSTRVRDIVDNALHGQLRAQANDLTGTTYRWHTLRLMQDNLPLVVGVHIGLGRPADRNLTKWQEMFLPRKLHDFAGSLVIRDATGATRKLVKREQVLFQATRAPEHEAPPTLWPLLLGVGLVAGGLFACLGVKAPRTAAVAFGVWSFVIGILGLLVTLLWTVTNHNFAHQNENLLLFNPLWLILGVPLVISTWSGRESLWARRLAITVAALSVIALLAHAVRLSAQDNLALIGLTLPPSLAIAWVVLRQRKAVAAATAPTASFARRSATAIR
ncbi:MAG TPA: DUF4105 domain-containing protein [Vicinamibacterales bacterium]|jgi:hypothetical protein